MGKNKRVFSFLLTVIMVLAIVPTWALRTRADEKTLDLMEPYVENDVVYWDPSINEVYVKYYAVGENQGYGMLYSAGTYNLYKHAVMNGFRTGDYVYELADYVDGQYVTIISGTYHYVAKYDPLDTPSNLKVDDYMLSWDAVPNAKYYRVGKVNDDGKLLYYEYQLTSTECSIKKMLTMNKEKEYTFFVQAIADDGHPWSEIATLKKTLNYSPDAIQNLTISEDGIMTWDAFPDAEQYKIRLFWYFKYAVGGPVWQLQSDFYTTTDTSLDVIQFIKDLGIANGKSGELYRFEVFARDKNSAQISQSVTIDYDYKYDTYDLYIMGTQINQDNLDFFGNGRLVFDPATNTLHCNLIEHPTNSGGGTDSLFALAGDGTEDLEPVIKTGMDLTIDGVLDLDVNVPTGRQIIFSTGNLTFAKDMVFLASSRDRLVHARNIEFLGGTYDLRCVSEYESGVEATYNIVINGDIESISVESNGVPMYSYFGTISLDDVIVETPEGGMLCPGDERYFVRADGVSTLEKLVLKPVPKQDPVTPDPVIPDPIIPDPVIPDPVNPDPQPVDPVVPDPVNPDPQPVDPQPVKEPSFEDFIERMYVIALSRPSEPAGKAFWMDKVKNEGFTGGRVAIGFLIEAPEFLNRNLSDSDFVDVLYKTFFDREADEGGKAFWMGHLASDMTREQVVRGFIDSTEWCNLCAYYGVKSGAPNAKAEKPSNNALKFATRLYTECLGREPDADGLQFWALRLTNLESSGYEAAKGFFESVEFQNKNVDDETYVKLLYRTFMGRDYDQGGLEFWLGHLGTDMNRLQVLQGFAQSQEFTNICNEYGIDRGTI